MTPSPMLSSANPLSPVHSTGKPGGKKKNLRLVVPFSPCHRVFSRFFLSEIPRRLDGALVLLDQLVAHEPFDQLHLRLVELLPASHATHSREPHLARRLRGTRRIGRHSGGARRRAGNVYPVEPGTEPFGCGSKLNRRGAGFGPCFPLTRASHFVPAFLSHSHLSPVGFLARPGGLGIEAA